MGGDSLGDIALAAHEEFPSPSTENARHQFRQGMDRCGVKHKTDVRIAPLQLIGTVLLSDHTPAHTDDHRGIRFLQMLVLSDDGQSFFLRVLPDSAGVHENQLRFCEIVGDGIAHQAGQAGDPLAVRLILLTAKGLHKAFGCIFPCPSVLCMDSSHLLRKAELPIYILPGQLPGSSVSCFDFFHQTASVRAKNSLSAKGGQRQETAQFPEYKNT